MSISFIVCLAFRDSEHLEVYTPNIVPCRVIIGLVVSVPASHTVGHEFASRPGHTKNHHKNGTDCLACNALG